MDRIVQMILRQVLGRVVNRGIDAGINRASRNRGRPADGRARDDAPDQGGERPSRQSNHVRGALRLGRRFMRF